MYRERNELVKEGGGGPNLNGHHQDFIDCIRNNKRSRADIEIGPLSSSLCHLGNIALRAGEMLHFDPVKEQMMNNLKAAKLVRREYREHWGTPKGV